jgi:hypothetical protein
MALEVQNVCKRHGHDRQVAEHFAQASDTGCVGTSREAHIHLPPDAQAVAAIKRCRCVHVLDARNRSVGCESGFDRGRFTTA